MLKGLLLLSLLCSLHALPSQQSLRSYLKTHTPFSNDDHPLMNLMVTDSGVITLTKTAQNAYTVPVNFIQGSDDSYNMNLALYQSETVFMANCLSFLPYQCNANTQCTKLDSPAPVNMPYVDVTASAAAQAAAYLDYYHWILPTSVRSSIVTDCSSNTYKNYGADSYGFIGLGTGSGASANFNGSVSSFAVYPDGSDLKLEFNPDMGNSDDLETSWVADANWKLTQLQDIMFGSTVVPASLNLPAIFDLNHPSIGLPLNVYNNLITAMAALNATCLPKVYYLTNCSFTGDLDDLPTLYFRLNSNAGGNFSITPSMYVFNSANYNKDLFQLNIRALDNSLSADSYVTKAFQNQIILGTAVLSNYRTQFNIKTGSVAMFSLPSGGSTGGDGGSSGHGWVKWLIIGLAIALVVVLLIVFVVRKTRDSGKNDHDKNVSYHKVIETEK